MEITNNTRLRKVFVFSKGYCFNTRFREIIIPTGFKGAYFDMRSRSSATILWR